MLRRALTIGVAAALAAAWPTVSWAETRQEQAARQAEIKDEIRTLKEEVSEASEEEGALLDRLDAVAAQRRTLDARVGTLDRQVAAVQADVDAAEATLDEVQGAFVHAQTQLAVENEGLAAEHARLRARAVAAYISNPTANTAELILRAGSVREIAAATTYLDTVVEAQRNAVRRFTERRDATEALQASVDERKQVARRQRDLVVSRLSQLEGLRREQETVRLQVVEEQARHEQLLEEVRHRRADFELQIAALRAESGTIAALLQGIQAGQAPGPPPAPGRLATPLPGGYVTSLFGPRLHPIFGTLRMHDGVDYGAAMGTPIRSAAAGTVVSAGPRGGYGNATIVDHGGGLATLYAHQSEMFVAPGTPVTAGQVIGAVGSTGFSTGPHLHFEARVAGVPVDPLLYL